MPSAKTPTTTYSNVSISDMVFVGSRGISSGYLTSFRFTVSTVNAVNNEITVQIPKLVSTSKFGYFYILRY